MGSNKLRSFKATEVILISRKSGVEIKGVF
jgi:hypothetical protein